MLQNPSFRSVRYKTKKPKLFLLQTRENTIQSIYTLAKNIQQKQEKSNKRSDVLYNKRHRYLPRNACSFSILENQ